MYQLACDMHITYIFAEIIGSGGMLGILSKSESASTHYVDPDGQDGYACSTEIA